MVARWCFKGFPAIDIEMAPSGIKQDECQKSDNAPAELAGGRVYHHATAENPPCHHRDPCTESDNSIAQVAAECLFVLLLLPLAAALFIFTLFGVVTGIIYR